MGTWLAFRPSEWAVEGIESISGHLMFTAYIAGMLSSLASNLPEAVISGLAAFTGFTTGNPDLLNIAILSVLVAAGFNMVLLGLTIVISTRKEGEMTVPEEVIKKDSVLIRWTIVALTSMFALGIVEVVFSTEGQAFYFPWEASIVLFLSYLIYTGVLVTEKPDTDTIEYVKPSHSRRTAAALWCVGLFGIFMAGEMLTSSVEMFLGQYETTLVGFGLDHITIAAFILGAAGAIPEHGIALIAAAKGKIGLAIGNLIGGILQILLLIMGGIGIFVAIPLSRYVLFQIIVIAGSLWFIKRAITDDNQLDTFEGMMIILLQVYVFILLLTT